MNPITRLLVCTIAATPLIYAAVAVEAGDQGWVILFGVVLFAMVYTVLDVLSYPTRPIDQAWLRRRISLNLGYLAVVGIISIVITSLTR